jgi:hypothetical protein
MESKFATLPITELINAYNILCKLELSSKFSSEDIKYYYNEYSKITFITPMFTTFSMLEIWTMKSLIFDELERKSKKQKNTIAQSDTPGEIPYLFIWNKSQTIPYDVTILFE